jgi:hypothetical protein
MTPEDAGKTSQAIWRRRVALMAAVGLLVALPLTLALRDGDDDSEPSGVSGGAAQVPPEVGPDVEDRGLGVTYQLPGDWEESKQASAIRLSSPDASAEVVIAAPAPAADADLLLDQTLEAFEASYNDVDIAPGSGRKIGGIDAKGAVVSASSDGGPLQILVAVAAGEERAYLVEVFTTGGVSADRLREAQATLNSLEFSD